MVAAVVAVVAAVVVVAVVVVVGSAKMTTAAMPVFVPELSLVNRAVKDLPTSPTKGEGGVEYMPEREKRLKPVSTSKISSPDASLKVVKLIIATMLGGGVIVQEQMRLLMYCVVSKFVFMMDPDVLMIDGVHTGGFCLSTRHTEYAVYVM